VFFISTRTVEDVASVLGKARRRLQVGLVGPEAARALRDADTPGRLIDLASLHSGGMLVRCLLVG
jgi:hypothetical protein